MRALVVIGLAMLALATPRVAGATENFPPALASHLGIATPPACTLCHSGTPGRGTVTTPFGVSMRDRGLMAFDEGTLTTALDALDAEKKDSDGDGLGDIQELKAGSDPNSGGDGGAGVVSFRPTTYGCEARVSPGSTLGDASVCGLAVAVAVTASQRRRSRRRCS